MAARVYFFSVMGFCLLMAADCLASQGMAREFIPQLYAQASDKAETGTEVREIRIVATDYKYDPARITATPGEKLRVTLANQGSEPHNIEFELPSGEVELEHPLEPGQSQTLDVTAPEKPGEYEYYCPVKNHHQLGMKGTLPPITFGKRVSFRANRYHRRALESRKHTGFRLSLE
jgi:plastocyanin